MRAPHPEAALLWLGLLILLPVSVGAAVTVAPVDLSLTDSGENYDDLCFWRHPTDPEESLAFVTSKDLSAVEVFRLDTGAHVTTLSGFDEANNCDVVNDLLVTTDSEAGEVVVHSIPDFARVHVFTGLSNPQGVGAFDRRRVYVSQKTGLVRVYDLSTNREVESFDTGMESQEALAIDPADGRVFVGDDDSGRIRVFTPNGDLLTELRGMFGSDAEGLALYRCGAGGYLLASDQSNDEFEVFDRLSLEHLGSFLVRDASGDRVNDTDGIDVFQAPTRRFPGGLFAACDGCSGSDDDADLVGWERIAAALDLAVCPDGGGPATPLPECTHVPATAGPLNLRRTRLRFDPDGDRFTVTGRFTTPQSFDPATAHTTYVTLSTSGAGPVWSSGAIPPATRQWARSKPNDGQFTYADPRATAIPGLKMIKITKQSGTRYRFRIKGKRANLSADPPTAGTHEVVIEFSTPLCFAGTAEKCRKRDPIERCS